MELLNSGTYAPNPGYNLIDASAGVRPHVAVFDLSRFASCVVAVIWRAQFASTEFLDVWTSGNLDLATEPLPTLITPPIPCAREVSLAFDLTSGTATGLLYWDLFGL